MNFGRNKCEIRSQVAVDTIVGAVSVTVANGSSLPTTNFWTTIGENLRESESRLISTRVGNVLNFVTATLFPHRAGEWVAYQPGEPEEVFFTSKTTGGTEHFNFDPPIAFESSHLFGETVVASGHVALPSKYGSDYPFYLPSNWLDRLKFLFDLARAAGVQIVLVSDR
jgi:hypothetical protein